MSTITEEKKPETSTGGADVVPDWAIGYTLGLPCDQKTPQCDREAEWFGNQHGCIRAHVCNEHMMACYAEVQRKIAEFGAVECRTCKREFTTFAAFIKAVRI